MPKHSKKKVLCDKCKNKELHKKYEEQIERLRGVLNDIRDNVLDEKGDKHNVLHQFDDIDKEKESDLLECLIVRRLWKFLHSQDKLKSKDEENNN